MSRLNFKSIKSILLLCCLLNVELSFAQPCQPGEFSSTGNAPCTSCEPGTYNDQVGQTACTSCSPGKFTASFGSSTCINCQVGQGSSARATSCSDCSPGSYNPIQGSTCLNCAAGTFNTATAATTCIDCQAGRSSSEGATECSECEPGKYNPTQGSICLNCLAGTFSPVAGLTSCQDCESGTVATEEGQTACTACESGTVALTAGSSQCSACGGKNVNIKTTVSGLRHKKSSTSDKISISGNFKFSNTLDEVNPALTGIRVVVEKKDGTKVVDAEISGGDFDSTASRGWSLVKGSLVKKPNWRYVDSSASPISGIKQIDFKVSNFKKGLYPASITVKIYNQTLTFTPEDLPLKTTLGLGSGFTKPCLILNYSAKKCKFKKKKDTLECK